MSHGDTAWCRAPQGPRGLARTHCSAGTGMSPLNWSLSLLCSHLGLVMGFVTPSALGWLTGRRTTCPAKCTILMHFAGHVVLLPVGHPKTVSTIGHPLSAHTRSSGVEARDVQEKPPQGAGSSLPLLQHVVVLCREKAGPGGRVRAWTEGGSRKGSALVGICGKVDVCLGTSPIEGRCNGENLSSPDDGGTLAPTVPVALGGGGGGTALVERTKDRSKCQPSVSHLVPEVLSHQGLQDMYTQSSTLATHGSPSSAAVSW